jgi:CBS domain-containing protein
MTRRDVHLDATLRHLGAAYYDSLHGRAAEADVARAIKQVEGTIGEGRNATEAPVARPASPQHHGRYHSRVRDIMTTSVISVDRITSYKEIAGLLAKHHIGGVPVLMLGRHVAGMVTDADLIAAAGHQDQTGWLRRRRPQYHALTAERLMTAPAVTIHPDAPVAAAARLLTEHHFHRMPVTDADGKLVGIVSRRDLIRLFLRPDPEIAAQVTELLADVLPAQPGVVTASVRDGVVNLAGQPPADLKEELRLNVKVIGELDGVIEVVDSTTSPQPT